MFWSSRCKALTGLVILLALVCLLFSKPALGRAGSQKEAGLRSGFRTAPLHQHSPVVPERNAPCTFEDLEYESAEIEIVWLALNPPLRFDLLPLNFPTSPVCFPSRHAPAGQPLYLSLRSLVI